MSDARRLVERKLGLLRDVLETTRRELLLVELDNLAPLLERKDALIGELTAVDQALAALGGSGLRPQQDSPYATELTRLVEAILENQRTMELRIDEERQRLRQEMRELDRQSRVRGYLERQGTRPGKVDLTR
jgi:hypothetical protein